MKPKFYIILAGAFLLTVQLKAQSPNAINFQGVARNSAGAILPNQPIGLEFTIYQGSATGTTAYQEIQTDTTNQFGLFTVAIGKGTVKKGTFTTISWGGNNEYLDVAMDPTGGTNYTDMGTQQLLSVPYALYAANAGASPSPWTIAGNDIYNNNTGSVGIGTTSLSSTAILDVQASHQFGIRAMGTTTGGYAYASGQGITDSNLLDFGTSFSGNTFVSGFDGEVTGGANSDTATDNVGVLGVATNPDAYFNCGAFNYGANSQYNTYGSYCVAQTNSNNFYTIALYADVNPDSGASDFGDYAGEFIGNVDVQGNLTKTGGNFKIDDPLDPANKYLYHSFVESPDMMNIYNGDITTDADGKATVSLPPYFEAENKDFKYQLTVIGQFAQAIIATKINNNQFTIKTDKPNVEVNWQVTGVRNDPWANHHPVVAEVEKKGIEKGHYLYPQYYGQPKTMGIAYLMSATGKNNSFSNLGRAVYNPTTTTKSVYKTNTATDTVK